MVWFVLVILELVLFERGFGTVGNAGAQEYQKVYIASN